MLSRDEIIDDITLNSLGGILSATAEIAICEYIVGAVIGKSVQNIVKRIVIQISFQGFHHSRKEPKGKWLNLMTGYARTIIKSCIKIGPFQSRISIK
jgi:hypothetical protein